MPIYDSNNTQVTARVQSALSHPDVVEIKNRTLDGKWHIQTIGSKATVVDVIAHFTMEQKIKLDTIKGNADEIKVVFDSRYYTGVIDGDINYARNASTDGPIFIATFTLLVETEGVE